ncbi:MAG TPA: hypothetical protein VLG45_12500 [Thermodesulfobacteriota bacterium]|nr:hypothetical protein [Thermodesulfobacteriota bacterium]
MPLIAAVMLFALAAGCNKEPEYVPGMSVQGFRASISKILFSPIAFDGATVAVEGIAASVSEVDPEQEDAMTNFRLVDLNGNFINVEMPGSWEISDNDYLIVGGIYRKNGNILEAAQYEMVELEGDDEDQDKEIQKRDNW